MSYFNDFVEMDRYLKIDGVSLPETSKPVIIIENNISDGGRLADNIDYEATLQGVKRNIELHYAVLNKEHFDIIYKATQQKYNDGGNFFMTIEVPDYVDNCVKTYKGYFQSTFNHNCVDTTEKHNLGDEYWLGGEKFDVLYRDVVISFVQK